MLQSRAAWRRFTVCLALAAGALTPALATAQQPAAAQQPAPSDAAGDSAAVPPPPPPTPRRFELHGYLTQGWARSTGTQFYGMTDRGSADFRYAAVQGRYAATASDHFLVQLNHRRLGRSPITDFESHVNLNWAFYERAFRDGTTLKAGRIPIPRGIYNELRSVGVALPTYRPPVVLYDEGAYFSETIDGLVGSRTFLEDRAWSLEAHAYAGGWRSLAYDTWSETYGVERVRAKGAAGAQLWLETPVDGLRLGVAAQRFRYAGGWLDGTRMKEWHASADLARERGFLRSEVTLQDYGSDKFYAGYAQLGVRPTAKLTLVAEIQRSRDTEVTYGDGTLPRSFDWHRSDGAGFAYAFTPGLVLKVERHRDRGIQVEQAGHPRAPSRFRYTIASLSTSF